MSDEELVRVLKCISREGAWGIAQLRSQHQHPICAKAAARIEALTAELAQVRAERDGAIADKQSMWRNAVTNTAALIDMVRRQHKIAPRNNAFAAFDSALSDMIDDWFNETRRAKPANYEEAEKVWLTFCQLKGQTHD